MTPTMSTRPARADAHASGALDADGQSRPASERRARYVFALIALLACLASRLILERTMWAQMLLQLPLLLVVGAYLASALARRDVHDLTAARASAWNPQGAAGLVLASGVVTLWMIPRLLDAALEQPLVDAAKMSMLLAAGAIGWISWRAAMPIVRVFMLGNVAWMTATVGVLLLDSPVRLCASYGANDQRVTGYGLVLIALFVVVAAFVRFSAPALPDKSSLTRPAHHVV